MDFKACAFTGHRPGKLPGKNNEADPRCVLLKTLLTEHIEKLAEAGITGYLSGMAQGVDTYCAEIVLALREKNPALKLHCILPCLDQDAGWPSSVRERYRFILNQADSVVYVSRDRGPKPERMMDRNRFMVDHASILLAVYNGTRRSGTGATINYAKQQKKEILLLDPSGHWIQG